MALEPEKSNFELLLRNVKGLNVDARCAAIACITGPLFLIDPGEGEWGYRTVTEQRGVPVPVCPAINTIQEKTAVGYQPLIAKIDIERGEEELFSQNVGWIDAFPLLAIELHDWLLPRSAAHAISCGAWQRFRLLQRERLLVSERNTVTHVAQQCAALGDLRGAGVMR